MSDPVQQRTRIQRCKLREHVYQTVRQNTRQQTSAFVKGHRHHKPECGGKYYLQQRFAQFMPGKQIQDVSQPKGQGGNDHRCFDAAVLQHGLEQEAAEDQLLGKADKGH